MICWTLKPNAVWYAMSALAAFLLVSTTPPAIALGPTYDGPVEPLNGSVLLRYKPIASFEASMVTTTATLEPSSQTEISTASIEGQIHRASGKLNWNLRMWQADNQLDPKSNGNAFEIRMLTSDRGDVESFRIDSIESTSGQKSGAITSGVQLLLEKFFRNVLPTLPDDPVGQGDPVFESDNLGAFFEDLGAEVDTKIDVDLEFESAILGIATIAGRRCLIVDQSGNIELTVESTTFVGEFSGYSAVDLATALVLRSHGVMEMSGKVNNERVRIRVDQLTEAKIH